ncbi:hypothetical protein Pst134EA_031433 [Puccinia striiformis f. sp. tritici]|uniref:uncharacterized protein n=1 Tax=Puccinia striiformis f. sp. tritici TaxID=168172 RepID=UPI0020078779|nr:uncharacterized protein Pst134EA_031433 [Puccinia striiformis f. sp. tritici]KAH9440761.1 hypothetical protein Pst134EA_031433 [Puccinia striiformis f. sp. tritici]
MKISSLLNTSIVIMIQGEAMYVKSFDCKKYKHTRPFCAHGRNSMKDTKHQYSYKSFTDDPTVPITPYEPPSDYDITTPKPFMVTTINAKTRVKQFAVIEEKLKPTLRLSTSTFPQVAILFEITSTLVY